MKKTLFVLFALMALSVCGLNAQSSSGKYIFPKYKEFVGYYYSGSYGGPMYYDNPGTLKVKAHSLLQFDITKAPFWEGCSNFLWVVNLVGEPYHMEIHGRDCTVETKDAGYGMVTINLIDKDGNQKSASFMLEIVN